MNLPTIALVTPSYNQERFLPATLRSVLSQDYPALEYVVIDGASTDSSATIIEAHAERLHAWRSEKDAGQYDAINKGFALTSGEVMGWLNSDDMHTPWALSIVGEIFGLFPEIEWLTTRFPMRWDEHGRAVACTDVRGYARETFRRGEHLPGGEGFRTFPVQQESTFWRRSLWERAGGRLAVELDAAADFDLWMRFAKHADLVAVGVPLAGFRRHGDQKTSRAKAHYEEQAMKAFLQHGGSMRGGAEGVLRNFCRDRLPAALRPAARAGGLLHPARVCMRSRDNLTWQLSEIDV